MAKYNVPDRKYSGGERKMCSFRLPVKLEDELEKMAKKKGWSKAELLITVLDEYIVWEKKKGSQ